MGIRKIFCVLDRRSFVFFAALIFLITSAIFVNSVLNSSGVRLSEGRNVVSLNISGEINVSALMKLNPEIEVVSYKTGNKTVGYANVFGGIGKDFNFKPDTEYEIYSSENATLIFPS